MLRGSVPSVQSRAQHGFSMAPQTRISRSKFNRSFGHKTTFDAGFLYPILVDEMLPGDTFHLNMHAFARLNTPVYPVMDNIYLETFFFAVPYRLVWEHWEQFNGYNADPVSDPTPTTYLVPQITINTGSGVPTGHLLDYMGIPTQVDDFSINSLHLRAYNLIWNEWFRDENLHDSVKVEVGDTGDVYADYNLLPRGKRHDYFTSCLPFPAKPADVNIFGTGAYASIQGNGNPTYTHVGAGADFAMNTAAGSNAYYQSGAPLGVGGNTIFSSDPTKIGLQANLDVSTAGTINDLRLAFQTQKFYEKAARGGTRYTEVIRQHFGVVSPDMRLQRPEYLGGGSSPVIVNPVAQTAPTSGSNALGQLAAYGISALRNHGFTYSATEHILILGLVTARADLSYQQGLERMWSRQTQFDFYWPVFAHLGEQAVLNKEIYLQGAAGGTDDDDPFGYQERYAEYRYKPSMITGYFRTNATGDLDKWHLAQEFLALPPLSGTFINENPPMARIMAVPDLPDFIMDAFFDYKCVRPMPVYAVPGLVDHF